MPPNTEARELFAALLFALTRADALPAYPAGSWQQENDERRRLAPDWTIDYHGPVDFTLGKTGLNYRIRALNLEESD